MTNTRAKGSDLTGLSLAAIALAMVALALVPRLGQGAAHPPADFSALVSRYCQLWTAAARSGDPAQVAPLYAQDKGLVFFGLGQSEYHGWTAYDQGMQSAVFDNAESLAFAPAGPVQWAQSGNMAWTAAKLHVSIVWADGRNQEFDAQQTAVWQKRSGKWLIVHEHLSSPALQTESRAQGT